VFSGTIVFDEKLTLCTAPCYVQLKNFTVPDSCATNSTFIVDCGGCQTCLITFGLQNGNLSDTPSLAGLLNTCLVNNTNVNPQVQSLVGQASVLSYLNAEGSSLGYQLVPATTTSAIASSRDWKTSTWDWTTYRTQSKSYQFSV
jgi:hypothetical protein